MDRNSGPVRVINFSQSSRFKEIIADQLQPWPCENEVCVICEEQFLGMDDQIRECMIYTRKLSDTEASRTAKRLASSGMASRTLLQQRLAKHGDLFMSRWKKRSKDKRVELLLRANADLPEKGNPNFFLTQDYGGDYDWREVGQPNSA